MGVEHCIPKKSVFVVPSVDCEQVAFQRRTGELLDSGTLFGGEKDVACLQVVRVGEGEMTEFSAGVKHFSRSAKSA
jgi:hypothetical protein